MAEFDWILREGSERLRNTMDNHEDDDEIIVYVEAEGFAAAEGDVFVGAQLLLLPPRHNGLDVNRGVFLDDDNYDDDGIDFDGDFDRPAADGAVMNDDDDDGGQQYRQSGFEEAVMTIAAGLDVYILLAVNCRRRGDVPFFRQFVALMEQQIDEPEQENDDAGRAIDMIIFDIRWEGLPDDAMDRLFGHVLPRHRCLREMTIDIGDLPARYFRMLTEAIPSPPPEGPLPSDQLCSLKIQQTAIGELAVQAVVDMLNRNAAVRSLHIRSRLPSDHCRRICQAVPRCTSLDYLRFDDVAVVRADTLIGAAASSSLRSLSVSGTFSEDAVPSLARQLRTNETLDYMYLNDTAGNGTVRCQELLELVDLYNITLRTVHGNLVPGYNDTPGWGLFNESMIQPFMNRNCRIRRALEELENPNVPDRLSPERLLQLLELASNVTTVRFRVVKLLMCL